MKLFLTLTTLFLYSFSAVSQSFEKIFSFSTGNNTYEYANTGIELSNGNYLIGINNKLLCLSSTGDSLWSKTYTYLGDIKKLYRDQNNKLMIASTRGKMFFVGINETNGDTLQSFFAPKQFSNSGYDILDLVVLQNGDYILAYNNGGGNGATVQRFTPKSTVLKWSNDYAGQNWKPRALYLEDTTFVVAGYHGVTGSQLNMRISKYSVNNVLIWNKSLARKAYYSDRSIGLQKNTKGNYLIATSWPINNLLLPVIVVVGSNGDSLSLNSTSSYNSVSVNGMLHSLQPSNNGFYAAGYLNFKGNSPDNKINSQGYMTVFRITDEGLIIASKAYNKSGYIKDGSNIYSGSEAWGTFCFSTSDGYYLLLGTGNKIEISNGSEVGRNRGYVVKSQDFQTGSIESETSDNGFELYPNPCGNRLVIKHVNPIQSISILSIDGTCVMKLNPNERTAILDLTVLKSSIYFIKVEDDQGNILYKKLIKSE